ncbi:hypothetical protein F2Q68_00028390 [Brassica cretica]|uniref:Neprosin PEP catalytic domain-containing protein n=1 Tax=Brassica cretica TaxID=69181 RepID=A0A8S9IE26_BRACR|nr:hypothetical protein F2Q68_00028390 [Brassica cretica]
MGMAGFAVALTVITTIISPCVYGKEFSDHPDVKVQRRLKQLNKPALKSIKSEDGDIIDCVPITLQPAFDHPLLKNHTIQTRPSFIPKVNSTYTKKEPKAITQIWLKNGECPENTVLIRRTEKEDILRGKSIESFGKKIHDQSNAGGHEVALMNSLGNYYGTQFVMNIWRPEVEVPNEYSLAQTWLGSGYNYKQLKLVYPGKYGDNTVRLFVYWTSDGYGATGCYNADCSGFVQRSKRVTVGGSYCEVSQYDGAQHELPILVWKDCGNWWLRVGGELVGYWPGSLFTSLKDKAEEVYWGGGIANEMTGGRHTTTTMGSGHFAGEWYKKASYFRKVMTVDGANTLREAENLHPTTDNDNCYSVKEGQSGSSYWGTHFFYGGPGRNAKCP